MNSTRPLVLLASLALASCSAENRAERLEAQLEADKKLLADALTDGTLTNEEIERRSEGLVNLENQVRELRGQPRLLTREEQRANHAAAERRAKEQNDATRAYLRANAERMGKDLLLPEGFGPRNLPPDKPPSPADEVPAGGDRQPPDPLTQDIENTPRIPPAIEPTPAASSNSPPLDPEPPTIDEIRADATMAINEVEALHDEIIRILEARIVVAQGDAAATKSANDALTLAQLAKRQDMDGLRGDVAADAQWRIEGALSKAAIIRDQLQAQIAALQE